MKTEKTMAYESIFTVCSRSFWV